MCFHKMAPRWRHGWVITLKSLLECMIPAKCQRYMRKFEDNCGFRFLDNIYENLIQKLAVICHADKLGDMPAQSELHECNYASDDQGPSIYEARLFPLCLYPNFNVEYLDKQ